MLIPTKADQMVRGTVNLPHGTGKTKRVLVFATGDRRRQPRPQVRTSWVPMTSSTRSKKAGSTTTLSLPHLNSWARLVSSVRSSDPAD